MDELDIATTDRGTTKIQISDDDAEVLTDDDDIAILDGQTK
jgi:hypothetical protein